MRVARPSSWLIWLPVLLCSCTNDTPQGGGGTEESGGSGETGESDWPDLPDDTTAPAATIAEFAARGSAACVREGGGTWACWGYSLDDIFTDEQVGSLYSPAIISAIQGAEGLGLGTSHACAAFGTEVRCWGNSGTHGKVDPGSTSVVGEPRRVEGLPEVDWVDTAAASTHSCALSSDGEVWCWGSNVQGGLGAGLPIEDGRQGPVQVVAARPYTRLVSAITGTTCAIDVANELWCWGAMVPFEGEPGGDELVQYFPTPVNPLPNVEVATFYAGVGFHLAIDTDGQMWGWGFNGAGQLGDGSQSDSWLPSRIASGHTWVDVSSSEDLVCALDDAGRVWCWGRVGMVNGNPDFGIHSAGYGRPDAEASATPVPGPAGGSWTEVECGSISEHTDYCCGLTGDGSFWCWGDDSYNQMGNGPGVEEAVSPRKLFSGPG